MKLYLKRHCEEAARPKQARTTFTTLRLLRRSYGLLAMTVLAVLFLPALALAQTFGAQTAKLDNGMEVIVIPNHRAPVVTHMVWYKVGAADELPGLSGMAHYFEHLMFKGTKTIAPGDFSKTVRGLGGNDNAFTGQDYTAYFQSIAKEHLPKLMEMESDRMVNLAPPPEHFKSEKDVVLEERRQRTENDPRALFTEQMRSALFVNHPYGIPVIGWMSEIKTYEWDDVKKFYEAWYAPNNAYLIVSGDITMDEVLPLAEKYYGALEPKTLPARTRPEIAPANGDIHMSLNHKLIRQPSFQRLYVMPSFHMNNQDALALQVLEEAISGGATTRLYQSLVVEQKKATGVNMSYSGDAIDYGALWISATPMPGVSLEELEELINDEIAKVLNEGLNETEIKDAIQRLQDAAIYARDSVSGPAMIFGHALTTGSSAQDVENWSNDIAAITLEDVNQAARTYLDPKTPWLRPAVTGYLMPEEEVPEPEPEPAPALEPETEMQE